MCVTERRTARTDQMKRDVLLSAKQVCFVHLAGKKPLEAMPQLATAVILSFIMLRDCFQYCCSNIMNSIFHCHTWSLKYGVSNHMLSVGSTDTFFLWVYCCQVLELDMLKWISKLNFFSPELHLITLQETTSVFRTVNGKSFMN